MKALDVAAHIINRCIDMGNPISNLKLQKILYFINMYYLVNRDRSLIDDNFFEAWQYGPVIEEVYNKYAIFVSNLIKVRDMRDDIEPFLTEDINMLYNFIDKIANIPSWQLVDFSHTKDGAWDRVYKNGIGAYNIIPNAFIEDEARKIRDNR
ncbi:MULTISPECIES: Panacea domain-containing protein [unclassified Campylobacter]|uniref:Panacea domain-containing protein n=1 Tax=unclassified Campylobacter TaxID=2593542 RepID=UPI003D35522D